MIPEEVTKFIGASDAPVILEVEKGAIKKYADAVGDTNPLYWHDEYARTSRYGSIVAPPAFTGWPVRWTGNGPFDMPDSSVSRAMEAIKRAGYPRRLNGGEEFEFFLPVRVGDILISSSRIVDVYERDSKEASMLFCVFETTYRNRGGAVVLKLRQTLIFLQ